MQAREHPDDLPVWVFDTPPKRLVSVRDCSGTTFVLGKVSSDPDRHARRGSRESTPLSPCEPEEAALIERDVHPRIHGYAVELGARY